MLPNLNITTYFFYLPMLVDYTHFSFYFTPLIVSTLCLASLFCPKLISHFLFERKSTMLRILMGPATHYREVKKRKKAQYPVAFETSTSWSLDVCSTTEHRPEFLSSSPLYLSYLIKPLLLYL